MSKYAIVEKDTLQVLTIVDNFIDFPGYEVIQLPDEPICGEDVLTARMNDTTIEVFSDPSKYLSCRYTEDIRAKISYLLSETEHLISNGADLESYKQSLNDVIKPDVNPIDFEIPRHQDVLFPWEM